MTLTPAVEHLLMMLAATFLEWAGVSVVPGLQGQPGWSAIAATAVTAAAGYVTPAISSYGIGSRLSPGRHAAGPHAGEDAHPAPEDTTGSTD